MRIQLEKRIIVAGHYGSGKTEFALNLAFMLREAGEAVTIVDLDVVNPYFRTFDAVKELEACGIAVVAPLFANTNVDVPALPPQIYGVFEKPGTVIFDVGGDDDGAVALGRFNARFKEQAYDMLGVVNTRRPLTETAEEIADGLRAIEIAARLRLTGLVNNTNLSHETTPDVVVQSLPVVREAAQSLGTSVRFVSVREDLAAQVHAEETLFPIRRRLKQW